MKNINIKEYATEIQKAKPDWSPNGEILVVYKIPLDKLYYNDENGRIATWISEYNNKNTLNDKSIQEKNDLIHGFIKKSNSKDSFEKTKNDIKQKGQIRPGVVLSDGRVVSGNRRFTVLRELYQETASDKYGYFECFIVEKDLVNEQERKEIKTIERLTQFGIDEKVDYDPIARLVDVYNDLIGPRKIFNIDEYSKKFGLKKRDAELMYYKAKIMVDYLEYINKPEHFHLARAKKLDGPLQELARIYDKVSEPEWKKIRVVFYANLSEKGDTTRNIRSLVNLYNDDKTKFDELLNSIVIDIEEQEEKEIEKSIQEFETQINEPIVINEDEFYNDTKIIEQKPENVLSEATKEKMFDIVYKSKIAKNKKLKVKKIDNALNDLMFYLTDVELMDKNERNEFIKKLIELKTRIDSILSVKE